eukprot:12402400-Karenia_brevis.AAC.1
MSAPSANPMPDSIYVLVSFVKSITLVACRRHGEKKRESDSLMVSSSVRHPALVELMGQYINVDNVSIVAASCRYVIVRVCCMCVDVYIISAHAPYWGASDDCVQWWREFSNILARRLHHGIPVIMGIDANCQIFNPIEGCAGALNLASPPRTPHFQIFEEFIREGNWMLTNTFEENANDSYCIDSSTYVHTDGISYRRIDYIMLSDGPQVLPRSVGVDPEFHFSPAFDDHFPLQCKLQVPLACTICTCIRRRALYDKAKLADPTCVRHFI